MTRQEKRTNQNKIYLLLDDEKYISAIAQFHIDDYIKTDYSVDDLDKKFHGKCITDGKHRFVANQIVKDEGSHKSNEAYKASKREGLRMQRLDVCFPIINRGKFWYETLEDKYLRELKKWYQEWLDVTETLVEPLMPEWLKPKEEDLLCTQD